jgi:hypothetical protein
MIDVEYGKTKARVPLLRGESHWLSSKNAFNGF